MDTKPAFLSVLGFRPPSVKYFRVKSFDSSVQGCVSPSVQVCSKLFITALKGLSLKHVAIPLLG